MYTFGFEAKRAFTNETGLGNYCRTLLRQLAERFPEHRYILYTPKVRRNERTAFFFEHPSVRIRKISSLERSLDLSAQLKAEHVDLFHGLSHELPLRIGRSRLKSVVTIHDLIALHFPEQYSPIDRAIYRFKMKHACHAADHIVAISESTREDIIRFYGVAKEKVSVIYQDCDSQFRRVCSASEKAAVAEKYKLPPRFFLSVGSVIVRKRLLAVVKAIQRLPEPQRLPLVVVGKGGNYLQEVKAYVEAQQLSDGVLFRENVAFSDLPAVYQQSDIFLYPSVYEGFGIPVLEAQHSGVPVITSRFSSLPEVGGAHSLQVNPDHPEELCDAILFLQQHPEERQKRIQTGRDYVQRFSSEQTLPALMRLYESLLG